MYPYYQQDDFAADRTFGAWYQIRYQWRFTLDAILVPDFGQTKFDNAILNLEPFKDLMKTGRFLKELIYSTLETYFILEELEPSNYPWCGSKWRSD
jgi:hypothetical protein